ncbi:cysteine-tryptophan domain-containing zinc finger protein 3-like [Vigna umbellata]|uniref:cysteine-tryptophan domain-containing zinc finger protein 3-like n=1 Tax=Vigna umbellata TaxID=87088 RepID=UPI001F5E4901|nr:cysteine-tryptophan domain-containing zinc finger protein 3-like [Vigna umbellata]
MISAGGRDAIKGLGLGLGLGLGAGRREMVESELEEGEACSFQNHEDYDATVDPDVALSYIDEKIQDVLGHFQKDFEGGLSAESLGAKYGGYGSFLPTYQRSPVWSHPRTPQKNHSQNTPKSPNNLLPEGGQGDAVQCSTGTQSSRLGPGSGNSLRMAANKGLYLEDGTHQEKYLITTNVDTSTSKHESLNKKFTSTSDQKPLKVRIKMGPDNLSTRKNAAIYSEIGLDVSPSSSLDDSPSESEGISRDPHEAPFESPTIILQIMTDLPQLLSPLSESIIELTIKEMRARDSIPGLVHLDDAESFDMSLNESNNVKVDRKLSRGSGRKMKSLEGCESSMEVKGSTKKNGRIDAGVLSRKEQSTDASTMEELVSNTMKLPLLSSSYSFSDDLVRTDDGPCDSLKETHKVMVREKTFSGQGQKEGLEPTSTEVNGFSERTKGSSRRKVVGDKIPFDDYIVKENSQGDNNCHSIMAESNVSKVRTASNTEEPPKKANQRGSLCEQDSMAIPVVTEHPVLVGKKKAKGSHDTVVMEREKEKIGSSSAPKTKRSSDDSSASKNETEDVRAQKNLGKTRDTYRDFFGELEDEEYRINSLETPFEEKPKEPEVVERSAPTTSSGAKERPGAKKADKLLTAEIYPKSATNIWCTGNANGTDAESGKGIPVMIPPVEMEDNWVQCDRCHKWRLLPVGTNPDNLPEKWLCSMLNWLPDMNRCSFSEDETTKALIALYQGPPFDGQSNLQNVSGSVMVGGAMPTSQHPNQHQLNNDVHVAPGGKKKSVKEISNSTNKENFSQSSYPMKKNLLSTVKSRSLNDVNKSPVMSEADVPSEKHKNKHRTQEHSSDRGDTKNTKVKSRRDHDQDFPRPSKKSKTDKAHSTNEEWVEQSGTTRKVGVQSSNSTFPTTSVGKDRPRQKAHSSSRDSKSRKDRIPVSAENTRDKGQGSLDEGSLDLGNCDSIGSVKKRKLKGYQDAITYSPGNPRIQESKTSEHDFSDSRKEKKAKSSKSGGKESSTSKCSGRTDKKVSHAKNQKFRQNPESSLSQRSLDGMDCSKRDLGPLQVSVAATSSSSKVSGSHKTKASFQEVKGSPVESVSSSPIRVLNADKLSNKEIIGKDDSRDVAAVDSPRGCLNRDDDGGSDRSGTARKDKSFTIANRADFQDKGVNFSDTKLKAETTSYCTNGGVDTIVPDGTYAGKEHIKHPGEDKIDVYHANMSHTRKNGIESGLEDNNDGCKSESHADKVKNSSSSSQLKNQSPLGETKHKDGKNKLQEKFGIKPDQSENIHAVKKDYAEKVEARKKESHLNRGHDFQDVSVDALCKQDAFHAPPQTQLPDSDRSTKRSLFERTGDQEVHGKGKLLSSLPSEGSQVETLGRCPRPVGLHKGNGDAEVDPSKVDDVSKLPKRQSKKTDNQNGNQQTGSRNPVLNGHRSKELDAPSPVRRDSYSHAANNAVKEAKDLKHLADRLKHSGSTGESTSLYFQAALKFLHGASLLESGNSDNSKHSEMIQSKQMYSSTAKLCEFCAHEYEKSKDMASAALAYKCMEVAYMRVVYSSHTSASRDRHELHNTLQMIPLGESPSSSASDVDNVNNSTAADKVVTISKSVNSPQVAGNHVIAARHRPNFVRLLGFAQDVTFAMEASRKSRNAFAAANSSLGVGKNTDGISSIKKALDFSFQDVEGLLRLVRVAVEAINR